VVTADPRPSYKNVVAEKAGLQTTIVVLRAEVAELKTKSLQCKGGDRPGGQPGATLTLVDDPDDRCRHEPAVCGWCGADLTGAREIGVEWRQVFDLPPPRIQVIEHQFLKRHCGCGAVSCGAASGRVDAPM
jgi:transposase